VTVAVHSIPLPAFPDAEQAGHLTELKRCAVSLPQFLIGPENRLAKVAVENQLLPGSSQLAFNPLVICGPAGCGKSRLASGLAAVWQQRYPRADILFLSSDQKIANDDRLDQHTTLMVIEDLDLCSGKPSAQRYLEISIDRLLRAGGRLLVTSAMAPPALKHLSSRLTSRLTAGLTINLIAPQRQTRQALLAAGAKMHGIRLTDSATAELANLLVGSSVAETLQALDQLVLLSDGDETTDETKQVDAEVVRRHFMSPKSAVVVSMRRIVDAAARHHNLKVADLKGRSRRRAVAGARNIAMYIASRHGKFSLKKIGKFLDGRDHTTVMHGCRTVEELLSGDAMFRQQIDSIIKSLDATWTLDASPTHNAISTHSRTRSPTRP